MAWRCLSGGCVNAHGWAPQIAYVPRVPRVRPLNARLWELIERENTAQLSDDETDELNALCAQLEDEALPRFTETPSGRSTYQPTHNGGPGA